MQGTRSRRSVGRSSRCCLLAPLYEIYASKSEQSHNISLALYRAKPRNPVPCAYSIQCTHHLQRWSMSSTSPHHLWRGQVVRCLQAWECREACVGPFGFGFGRATWQEPEPPKKKLLSVHESLFDHLYGVSKSSADMLGSRPNGTTFVELVHAIRASRIPGKY